MIRKHEKKKVQREYSKATVILNTRCFDNIDSAVIISSVSEAMQNRKYVVGDDNESMLSKRQLCRICFPP